MPTPNPQRKRSVRTAALEDKDPDMVKALAASLESSLPEAEATQRKDGGTPRQPPHLQPMEPRLTFSTNVGPHHPDGPPPKGWLVAKAKSTDKPYYYNPATKKSSNTMPGGQPPKMGSSGTSPREPARAALEPPTDLTEPAPGGEARQMPPAADAKPKPKPKKQKKPKQKIYSIRYRAWGQSMIGEKLKVPGM